VSNIIALAQPRKLSPTQVNGKVCPPIRRASTNPRKYLTPGEVEKLRRAASGGRYGQRDSTLVLLAFRHGLRVAELVALEWSAVDLTDGNLHVKRKKHGSESVHPLHGVELRALRELRRAHPESRWLFVSERDDKPMTTSNVRKILTRLGIAAKIGFPVHPHQLRHATGFALANKGVDTRSLAAYLGHRSLESTRLYTDTAPNRFKDFFRD